MPTDYFDMYENYCTTTYRVHAILMTLQKMQDDRLVIDKQPDNHKKEGFFINSYQAKKDSYTKLSDIVREFSQLPKEIVETEELRQQMIAIIETHRSLIKEPAINKFLKNLWTSIKDIDFNTRQPNKHPATLKDLLEAKNLPAELFDNYKHK